MTTTEATKLRPKRSKPRAREKKKLKAQGRQNAVKEWIGATPDSRPPKTVRLRIFDREGGICYLTGLKIDATKDDYDLDHKKRLEDGGENRESNLFPVLRAAHRKKTADENRRSKKADRVRMKHLGIKDEPARPAKQKPSADPFPHLPRRSMYVDE